MTARTFLALVLGLAAFAVGATPAVAQIEKEFINPAGGYTHVVTVKDRGVKTVYVSGQVGSGADLQAHAESAFQGVADQLEAAGASMRDVVKIRIYVTEFDPEQYSLISAARLAAFPEDAWPVSTMLGINALAREGLRVEIEATAVLADPGADFELTRIGPSRGFSQAVVARHGAVKTIWVSGQIGRGDDLTAQTSFVFDRVSQRLAPPWRTSSRSTPTSSTSTPSSTWGSSARDGRRRSATTRRRARSWVSTGWSTTGFRSRSMPWRWSGRAGAPSV